MLELKFKTTIKQLCDLILDLKKSDLKVNYKPYDEDDARALVQNRIGSAKKAKNEIQFTYEDSLKDGLSKLIEWRRKTLV